MQRIKRHATYFTDRTKQNHWCEHCYAVLKDDQRMVLDDGTEVVKSDLQEFKNDALPEEGWVNCDDCNSWVHQVCALFNGRTNKTTARYTCPNCFLRKIEPHMPNTGRKLMKCAKDLAHCNMSMAIEKGLEVTLEAAYAQRARELGISAEAVEKSEPLTVRVISNTEKKHVIGEEVRKDLVCTCLQNIAAITDYSHSQTDARALLRSRMRYRVSCSNEMHSAFSNNSWSGYIGLCSLCLRVWAGVRSSQQAPRVHILPGFCAVF
jgi:hypothetical protein